MEVRHLQLLRELKQRGTLGAVATATFRTPSALSQQLRTAESELGVALVEPVSRGLRLTWAGEILAAGADDVLAALARVQARLDEGLGEPSGSVRVGTLPSAGVALLPEVMARLAGSLISVEIEDFDLAEEGYAGKTLDFDIVIAHSLIGDVPVGAESLFSRVVAREPIDVAVPVGHPLASQDSVAPSDVAGLDWVVVPRGFPFATIHEAIEASTGTALNRVAEVRDNRLVESLVARGIGVGLLPRFSYVPTADFVLLPLREVHAVRSIVVIGRRDKVERRAVGAVVDVLAAVGAGLS